MYIKQAAALQFADHEAGSAEILRGWDPPDEGVRWPQGRVSRLVFPRPAWHGDLLLLFEVVPQLAPPLLTQQTLRVRVNGVTQRLAYLSHPAVMSVHVPAALAAERPALELDFDHPDVVRPDMVAGVQESRGRSVGFRSLTVLEVERRPAPAPAVPRAPALPPPETLSDSALAGYFASIGDNCEFGLMQRRAGAELMDLLRFAGTDLPGLLLGLGECFAEINTPGAIDLTVHPFEPRGEYVVAARRYNFQAHTGQFEGDMDVVRLYIRELRKLTVTQRLFAGDLASGHRILVFKHNDLTEHTNIGPLLEAIGAHGPAVLLHVVRDGTGRRLGQVEQVGPTHLRGYIDRFNPYDNAAQPSSPLWEQICRNAYAIWRGGRLAMDQQAVLRAEIA